MKARQQYFEITAYISQFVVQRFLNSLLLSSIESHKLSTNTATVDKHVTLAT
jgi:hypothetical protein